MCNFLPQKRRSPSLKKPTAGVLDTSPPSLLNNILLIGVHFSQYFSTTPEHISTAINKIKETTHSKQQKSTHFLHQITTASNLLRTNTALDPQKQNQGRYFITYDEHFPISIRNSTIPTTNNHGTEQPIPRPPPEAVLLKA